MTFTIAPIVEGHGDVAALPVLLRRIQPSLLVARPVRFPRSRLLIDEHLDRAVRIAASNIREKGAVLLVVDSDDDCAAIRGPEFEERMRRVLPQTMVRAVLAVREFEAWIVGGDAQYGVEAPDTAGDLKGRIRDRHGVYSEAADQPRLTSRIDIERLEKCSRSFRKLSKVVREFIDSAGLGVR